MVAWKADSKAGLTVVGWVDLKALSTVERKDVKMVGCSVVQKVACWE